MDVIVYSPDGTMLATSGAKEVVQVWEAASGKLLKTFAGGFEHGYSFGFHPDGKALVTAGPQHAAILNLPEGTLRMRSKNPNWDGKSRTSLCPNDDTIITVFSGGVRRVIPEGRRTARQKFYWTMIGIANIQTGKLQRSFRVETENLHRLCMSPDRRMLAAVGQHVDHPSRLAVFVWDLQRGVEFFHADLPKWHACEFLAFSADNRTLFLVSGRSILESVVPGVAKWEHMFQILEIPSGKPRVSFRQELSPNTNFSCGAIASDHLAAFSKGSTISLFDPLTGKEYGQVQTGQDRIGCLAFSPDGKQLASAGGDTTALIWDIAGQVPAQVNAMKSIRIALLCLTACFICLFLWRRFSFRGRHKAEATS